MDAATHLTISRLLCGEPVHLEAGRARVVLDTVSEMAVDTQGLVHGGFVFGAADYAAMLAVNDPNVVLGASECRFLAPVRLGESVDLEARVRSVDGRKHEVEVTGRVGETAVFEGRFTCFVLGRHVLEGVG